MSEDEFLVGLPWHEQERLSFEVERLSEDETRFPFDGRWTKIFGFGFLRGGEVGDSRSVQEEFIGCSGEFGVLV